MKKLLKSLLNESIIEYLRYIKSINYRIKTFFSFYRSNRYDTKKYLKYSRTFGSDNPTKMIGAIVLQCHVIEKGLTMPETRLGFGKKRIVALCNACLKYVDQYGYNDEQLYHAIGVILEYEEYHESKDFMLDDEIKASIRQIKKLRKKGIEKASQIQTTKKVYFKHINSSFYDFSNSRASVRNFSSESIGKQKLLRALKIVEKTPSACNRQPWRTYILSDHDKIKKILKVQRGSRGFGHLSDKLIIITSELGGFSGIAERHQAYIDGGMYAMNLLYALHFNEISACILNGSFVPAIDKKLRNISKIKESEVLIAFIACGISPKEFKLTKSLRYSFTKTNKFID